MKDIFKQIHRFQNMDFEDGKPFEFTLDGKKRKREGLN